MNGVILKFPQEALLISPFLLPVTNEDKDSFTYGTYLAIKQLNNIKVFEKDPEKGESLFCVLA